MHELYRLHKNIYVKQVDTGVYALYNPLFAHSIVFIKDEVYEYVKGANVQKNNERFQEPIRQLIEMKFLVPIDFDDNIPIREIARTYYPEKPRIAIMYLILTEQCNFKCKYCFIEENIYEVDGERRFSRMSIETADEAIDLFIRVSRPDRENKVIIYGGEPLLNKKVFIHVVKRLRSEEKQGRLHNLQIIVNTNASLVNDEIADVFAKFNVIPAVSFDGTLDVHNAGRIDFLEKGTFASTLKGYRLLQQRGSLPSISCTVTKFNIEHLQESVEYFVNELGATNMGFNLLVDFVGQPNSAKVDIREATKRMISAFEFLRKQGVYEDRIMRRVEPFMDGRIYSKECGAYGNQIVVAPDGKVGPCHAFLGTRDYFVGDIRDLNFNPENNETFQLWNNRNPFSMPECWDCPFITLCGGGCAYEAFVLHGSIRSQDERMCEHLSVLLDWLLQDLWEQSKSSKASR